MPSNSQAEGAQDIWWNTDGTSLAFFGQVPDEEEQVTYQQIYWVDAQNGTIVDSYTANEWPLDSSISAFATGGIDQLLFEKGRSEFYLLDRETKVLTPLLVNLPGEYYRYDSEAHLVT